ncbi:acyltransferase [Ketobacter sp. MCCC 1A13808]|uniref:acyltransferase family protein n=1 Tax=Ketobacter sp. MCCC 1A13808 TaxID=2602738 RepID=UPI000F29F2EA|nr:acyltransferase [Ketobacter sp. MCCC 1A13808]MVF13130.1 acyltransferase [Ketobacter sp. MCCC 1A13808]RLP54776.1 MAG: acyltransferase [Ketobacter sp.]
MLPKTVLLPWQALKSNTRSAFIRPANNVDYIDGLRGLSCLAILLYHSFFLSSIYLPFEEFDQFVKSTPGYLTWIWGLDKSVDVFFTISGFLIGRLLFLEYRKHSTLDLKTFYWRRYLRLTPAYLFAIGVFYLLAPASMSANLWANLLYVNNFLPLETMSMSWTWTLAVEEQFYLLFPLLLLWLILPSGRPLFWLLVLFLSSSLIIAVVSFLDQRIWHWTYAEAFSSKENIVHYFDRIYVNIYTRFGPLVAGAIVAYLHVHHSPAVDRFLQNRGRKTTLTLIALLIIVVGIFMNGNKHWLGDSVWLSRIQQLTDRNLFAIALCWIIVICGDAGLAGRTFRALLGARLWYPFAQFSYTLYLFHYMLAIPLVGSVIKTVQANLRTEGMVDHHWMLLTFAVLLLCTLPICYITYVLIEKPFMNLRGKGKQQNKPARSVAAPSE